MPPLSVFSSLFYFRLEALPPFYQSVLNAWRLSGGLATLSCLAVGSFLPTEPVPVEAISTKEVNNMCLAASECTPHCTQKYSSAYPDIDWVSTWRTLHLMPLDRQVTDLNWKIAHGVTYTADRLISFGYLIDPMCFCGGTETPEHLFFSCTLAQQGSAWVRPFYHLASPQAPAINDRIVLFGFTRDELLCVPRAFTYILNALKYFIWRQRNVVPSHLRLIAQIRARVSFFFPLFFKRFRSPRRKRFFLRQWDANGTLGFLSGGSFKVTL